MVYDLIAGKDLGLPMPILDDMQTVEHFFKRAPEMAETSLKDYVTTLCKGYLEDMKA